jgi:hypothetical protein
VQPTITTLEGIGIDGSRLLRLAEGIGLPLRSGHDGGGRERVLALWQRSTVDEAFGWLPPAVAWIQVDGLSDEAVVDLGRRARGYALFASLTTTTANDVQIAAGLLDALTASRAIDDGRREDIELALHEAVSNAIIHGNLRIDGLKNLSVEDLDNFSRLLAARLADPAFAHRRVEVRVAVRDDSFTVDILDEGGGYPADRLLPAEVGQASGRGLDLIGSIARACQPLDNGRHLRMEFDW